MRREDLPSLRRTLLEGWHFLVPVAVLLYFMAIVQVSPGRAAAWALLSFVPLWLFRELHARRRIEVRQVIDALDQSSRSAVMLAGAGAILCVVMAVDRSG